MSERLKRTIYDVQLTLTYIIYTSRDHGTSGIQKADVRKRDLNHKTFLMLIFQLLSISFLAVSSPNDSSRKRERESISFVDSRDSSQLNQNSAAAAATAAMGSSCS